MKIDVLQSILDPININAYAKIGQIPLMRVWSLTINCD